MKLNGWRRLWVVTSILWFVGISLLNYKTNYNSHKSDAEIYHAWSNEIIEYLIAQVPELKGYSVTSLRFTYSDMSDKELIEALHKKFISKHPAYEYGLTEIDSRYENKISSKGGPRYSIWITYGLLAIGVPVCLYAFGWAIAWIKNGFKSA